MNSLKSFLMVGALVLSSVARAQGSSGKRLDVEKDVDSLGGNDAVIEMAKALDPHNRSRIVQKRIVDRDLRFEFDVNYGGVFGGDPYTKTQNLGAALEFHINPRWSVGLHYTNHGTDLSPEGQRVFNDASASYATGGRAVSPDIDPMQQSYYGSVSWYPVYGKVNLFDAAIAQFDLYIVAGGGQMQTEQNGWSTLMTGGLGMGLWLNKHWSVRSELRAQKYQDLIVSGQRDMTSAVASVGIGFLL